MLSESGHPMLRLFGQEFILVGDYPLLDKHGNDISNGAIATQEDYDQFNPSYCHLFSDGRIQRYGVVIGKREDIEWL